MTAVEILLRCQLLYTRYCHLSFFYIIKKHNHRHVWICSQEVYTYYMRRGGGATQSQGIDIIGCVACRKENPRRRIRKRKKRSRSRSRRRRRKGGKIGREFRASKCRVATQYLVDRIEIPLLCKTRIEQST